MDSCDVLIVGGGPAGAACAWGLRHAGLDVMVADKANFPRDKVCAGWITPQVIDDLQIDPAEYSRGRTFQAITGFRVGFIGGDTAIATSYDRAVSFGIRRCEFDDYLLRRAGARLRLGMPLSSIRRDGREWIVDESVSARMLVGAGGHFCPVARLLNGTRDRAPLVVAQEAEFRLETDESSGFPIAANLPELYFCPDLTGYGWCFRKGSYLNVGFGRLDRRALPAASAEFVAFLKTTKRIPHSTSWRWHGHAYLVSAPSRRRVVDDGVMLVGDAAGLAYPQSGEGIRPAIESGLLAADAIADVAGRYTRDRLECYAERLRRRFGLSPVARLLARAVPDGVAPAAARHLLQRPWFVRRVVLDRWFLRSNDKPLARDHSRAAGSAQPLQT